jgi:lactoylglutathione lyase
MLRVRDLDAALDFFCTKLGLVELRRTPDEKGRYTKRLSRRPAG